MSANVVSAFPQRGIHCLTRRMVNKGSLVAFCDLKITAWNLVLKDCKWFKKGPAEWVGLPSSSYTNRDGKMIYKDLVEFDDKHAAERFQAAALAAVHDFKEP